MHVGVGTQVTTVVVAKVVDVGVVLTKVWQMSVPVQASAVPHLASTTVN